MGWLFGSKKKNIVSDKVWVSKQYKTLGLISDLKDNPDEINVVCCYFSKTYRDLTALLDSENIAYKEIGRNGVLDQTSKTYLVIADILEGVIDKIISRAGNYKLTIFFAEHYPLRKKEKSLLDIINVVATEKVCTCFYTSLDEPLFSVFGGSRVADMIKKMGMKESDCLQHSFITSAIIGAQEKIEKNVTLENKTMSPEEWFRINIKNDSL